jgi:hypothetical protein
MSEWPRPIPTAMKTALFTLDNWYWWSQIAVVVAGAVALLTGKWVNDRQSGENKRQAKELLKLQTDLSQARTKQAEAERSLLELKELIREPRTVDEQRAHEILDWGEKGSLDIFFSLVGDEPENLAKKLATTLNAHGWRILSVQHAIPVALRTGILITAYGESKAAFVGAGWAEAPEPAKTLHRLLVEAVVGNPVVETRISPDQPKDKLAVTIAAKY